MTRPRHGLLQRRALSFALQGVVACILLVAVLDPGRWTSGSHFAEELALVLHGTRRGFEWVNAPALVAVGAVAGLLVGMLGMGGGVLKVAGMLVFFHMDIYLARAVSLVTMFVATASAAAIHLRSGNVRWQVVRPMIVPALVAICAGMAMGNYLAASTLVHLFAFFVLFFGFNALAQSFADPGERTLAVRVPSRLPAHQRIACAFIGASHGFVCGLLGISGGVTAIPMQQTIVRIPTRHAVANTVVVSALATGVGGVIAAVTGLARNDFLLSELVLTSACIGIGAVAGARISARVSGSVRVFYIKQALAYVSLAAGAVILFK